MLCGKSEGGMYNCCLMEENIALPLDTKRALRQQHHRGLQSTYYCAHTISVLVKGYQEEVLARTIRRLNMGITSIIAWPSCCQNRTQWNQNIVITKEPKYHNDFKWNFICPIGFRLVNILIHHLLLMSLWKSVHLSSVGQLSTFLSLVCYSCFQFVNLKPNITILWPQ